jgi:hypothetical protein
VVEVLAVNILEKYSGFRLSESFHIAFAPPFVDDHPWDKLSNELKMSHNLIINALEPLFKDRGKAKDFRLSYRSESMELQNIEEQVKKTWVPALNQMTSETFSEFVRAAYYEEFLEPYNNLRLASEWQVDINRFFNFALRNGLNTSAIEILESTALRHQDDHWSAKLLVSEDILTYNLF